MPVILSKEDFEILQTRYTSTVKHDLDALGGKPSSFMSGLAIQGLKVVIFG